MRSGFLLLLPMLILLLLSLPLLFAGTTTPKPVTSTEPNTDENRPDSKADDEDKTCIPPVFVVMFFTLYGIFLLGLYIYGGKQWIGLVEAKFKLRKLMALEIALINYDAFCADKDLHGRAEVFIPALNDGFFMDPDVQEAWLSVNNLRDRIYKVDTSNYKDIMRENWATVKNIKLRKLKNVEMQRRNPPKNRDGSLPKLNLQSLCHLLMTADIFNPSVLTKPTEEQAAEGTDNQPGPSQIKEIEGSAEKNLMEQGKKDDDKKTDPSMEKKDQSEKKERKKEMKTKKTKTETTKEGTEKKDSKSDPKKDNKKEKKSEERELEKKDEEKEKKREKTEEKKKEKTEEKKKEKTEEKKREKTEEKKGEKTEEKKREKTEEKKGEEKEVKKK